MAGLELARRLGYLLKRHPFWYRFRYALITELAGVEFGAPPIGDVAKDRVPGELTAIVSRLDLSGDEFDDARRIAFDLSHGHHRGPGLGTSTVKTLTHIYGGKRGGVCSDYTQVFLGLCRAAGIAAREWGLCARFESHVLGHALAEIFSGRHGKWVFIDPLFSVWASRRGASAPLAVTEMVDLVSAGRPADIVIELIDAEGKPGEKRNTYVERYFNPDHAFFLLTNNDVFKQDTYLRWAKLVPLPIVHAVMLLSGDYQRFHVYVNAHNKDAMARRIEELNSWLRSVSVALAALALVILAAAVALF